MKKIIITGAGGMIGEALTQLYLSNGDEVTALLRHGSGKLSHIKNGNLKIVHCDLSQLDSLNLSEEHDIFFHLGWASTFGEERNDTETQVKNIEYTLSAVKTAKRAGCKAFVSVGSQAEYGLSKEPLNSETKTNPITGYGIAKLASGKLSRIMCEQNGIRHCHARILSVYGERDREGTLISSAIDSMLCGVCPPLTGCEQMWDYIYSGDAAKALYLIGEKGKDGAVYCVGSGQCRPLREYVEIIKEETAFQGTLEFFRKPYSENQVMYLCADIKELQKDTGFSPTVTFREGIKRTIAFRKDRCKK